MDKTAIDRRYKLKEEKGQLVNQMIEDGLKVRGCKHEPYFCQSIVEPRSEKAGLRGFRPGPTQIGLYSH